MTLRCGADRLAVQIFISHGPFRWRLDLAYLPGMSFHPITVMLSLLGVLAAGFTALWTVSLVRLRRQGKGTGTDHGIGAPRPLELLTGALTMFFDTLGIGAFAPTTALIRVLRLAPDQLIPGTLNVGHSLASILQAFIYTAIIPVDAATLILTVLASTVGAWLGAGVVARWPKQRVRLGMGVALLVAAGLMLLGQLEWLPAGGTAIGLSGWRLIVAVAVHLLLGALMTLGIGLFAPCMILLSFLGMSPKAIFPIMMTACAFLMPVGGLQFIRKGGYAPRLSLALTLGGVPAVCLAAFLVKELPLYALRWMVLGVVVYTGVMLLRAAVKRES